MEEIRVLLATLASRLLMSQLPDQVIQVGLRRVAKEVEHHHLEEVVGQADQAEIVLRVVMDTARKVVVIPAMDIMMALDPEMATAISRTPAMGEAIPMDQVLDRATMVRTTGTRETIDTAGEDFEPLLDYEPRRR